MMKNIAILIGIVSVVTAFYTSAFIGWVILGVASASLMVTYFAFRIFGWKNIPELSPEANKRLRKFSHLYNIPSEDEDLSDTTDMIAWAGILLAILGCFQGFWWGIAIGAANYAIMEFISSKFDLNNNMFEYRDLLAHEEILNWLDRKAEEALEKRQAEQHERELDKQEHQKAA